jgi:hypothetical protein
LAPVWRGRVVATGVLSWALTRGDNGREVVPDFVVELARPVGGPTRVRLPDPSPPVADWVEGPGSAAIQELQAAVLAVLADPDADCVALLGWLEGTDPPDDLVALAKDAPAAAAAELVVSEVMAAGRMIDACDEPAERKELVCRAGLPMVDPRLPPGNLPLASRSSAAFPHCFVGSCFPSVVEDQRLGLMARDGKATTTFRRPAVGHVTNHWSVSRGGRGLGCFGLAERSQAGCLSVWTLTASGRRKADPLPCDRLVPWHGRQR